MPSIIKELLLSKKFITALFTAAGSVTAYFGWNVDPTALLVMMTPFLIYIGAQGWGSDAGKEQAKINAAMALQLNTGSMAKLGYVGSRNENSDLLEAIVKPEEG